MLFRTAFAPPCSSDTKFRAWGVESADLAPCPCVFFFFLRGMFDYWGQKREGMASRGSVFDESRHGGWGSANHAGRARGQRWVDPLRLRPHPQEGEGRADSEMKDEKSLGNLVEVKSRRQPQKSLSGFFFFLRRKSALRPFVAQPWWVQH